MVPACANKPMSDPDANGGADANAGDCVVKPSDSSLVSDQQRQPDFGRSCNFPNKLFGLLAYATTHETSFGHLITWSSNGLSFDIWNPEDFMIELGKKFFPQQASFRALERQLNNWGFIRTKLARPALRFYHPLFQRDKPHLKRYIHRSTLHKPTPSASTKDGASISTRIIQSHDPSSPQAPLSGMGHGRRLHCAFQILQGGSVHDCNDEDDDDDGCNLLNCHVNTLQESLGFFKHSKDKHFYSKAHS